MSTDTTQITIILDRTGSMQAIRDDTIGGFNAFLAEQKAHPAPATLTLVRFDSQDPYEVIHDTKRLAEVPELTRETSVARATPPAARCPRPRHQRARLAAAENLRVST
jgi:hypothetical protein